jgi:hypothetical protein
MRFKFAACMRRGKAVRRALQFAPAAWSIGKNFCDAAYLMGERLLEFTFDTSPFMQPAHRVPQFAAPPPHPCVTFR